MSPASLPHLRCSLPRRKPRISLLLTAVLLASLAGFGCASHTFDGAHRASHDRLTAAGEYTVYIDLNSDRGNATNTQVGDYGSREAILAPPFDQWLSNGLRSEFRRAGFRVSDTPGPGPEPVHVKVQVIQVFSERAANCAPFADCTGGVASFDVEITDPRSGDRFLRRFVGTSSDTTTSSSVDDLEDRIRESVSDAYLQIVTETHALLTAPPGN